MRPLGSALLDILSNIRKINGSRKSKTRDVPAALMQKCNTRGSLQIDDTQSMFTDPRQDSRRCHDSLTEGRSHDVEVSSARRQAVHTKGAHLTAANLSRFAEKFLYVRAEERSRRVADMIVVGEGQLAV
jgi:hypothetical protein